MTMMPELPTCWRGWAMVTARSCSAGCCERGMQELIDAELTAAIGAAPHERTDARSNQRNGSRSRLLSTPAGDIELRIPKVRVGSFFPSLLEPRRRVDQGVVGGDHDRLHHRHLDPQGRRPGPGAGLRVGGVEVDGVADLRRDRRGGRRVPHPTASTTSPCRTCTSTPPTSRPAATIASCPGLSSWPPRSPRTGTGRCSASTSATARTRCSGPRSSAACKDRGLHGVRLVISDAHAGLKASIARVFAGASWQRCKVHLMRNLLGTVASASKDMVAATVRTIFAQPDAGGHPQPSCTTSSGCSRTGSRRPPSSSPPPRPTCSPTPAFPRAHWRKIASTNPLERINKEIKRRSNVVGHLPRRRLGHPPRRRRPARATRRLGRHRPPLPLRRIHGPHRPRPQEVTTTEPPELPAA